MRTCLYDIEALDNIFTNALYTPDKNRLDLFYLDDDKIIANNYDYFIQNLRPGILSANRNLKKDVAIMIWNLSHPLGTYELAKHFPLYDSMDGFYDYIVDSETGNIIPFMSPPTIDIETHKADHDLYYLGYNSYQYDMTELAMFFEESYHTMYKNTEKGLTPCVSFVGTSAKQMRIRNNELFSEQFKNQMNHRLAYDPYDPKRKTYGRQDWNALPRRMRQEWLKSGRYIDVARLNEKQFKIALKRLLGMSGYQILESDKLDDDSKVTNIDEVIELLAYNVSDVVNLEKLFLHPVYSARFELVEMMLKEYPELIFNKKEGSYAPDVYIPESKNPPNIRKDRMCIDSSSAQIATNVLCPYGNLDDIETVSFFYPSEQKAKELGIPRVDVLEESKKFFYEKFHDYPDAIEAFNRVYDYYDSIRGKNFNPGDNYQKKYNKPTYVLKDIPQPDTNLFYYNKDGSSSGCYVTFSAGGIHGQEVAYTKLKKDLADYQFEGDLLSKAKMQYTEPTALAKAKTIIIDDIEYKASKFLKSGSNMTRGEYKDKMRKTPPRLIKEISGGKFKLDPRYAYTSCGLVNHEDFKSYYPLLLVMLEAFANTGLGYDRYHKLYDLKEEYGRLEVEAKKMGKSDEARYYKLLRDGVKLILNSATGAGDTNFPSKIQMNNRIISMRIIGQLFSWRVGQEQTYQGARIPSTNTDGLYSFMEEDINNRILEDLQKIIHVDIEPERLYLISKDTNNRMELSKDKSRIKSAAGGSLACLKGPDPRYALSHPAILDWALGVYMINFGVNEPFDNSKGLKVLKAYQNEDKLLMFQNVLASSSGMRRFIFGEKEPIDETSWAPGSKEQPVILQHYNRVFYLKERTENTLSLRIATARKITPSTLAKRDREGMPRVQNNPLAVRILQKNHAAIPQPHDTHEATIVKIDGIEPDWHCLIVNEDLNNMPISQKDKIYQQLDFDIYVNLLKDTYEDNWRNIIPNE